MKTFVAKKENLEKRWFLVDAEGKVVGRLATKLATLLRGKGKPIFSPHLDCGDYIICINAEKVVFTGKKLEQKLYYRHSGYMGGQKSRTAERLLREKPREVIREAVKGMLPKNHLGRKLLKNLKVYAGSNHPHKAQMPQRLEI
ncbi:50S ribosomal protein L13 [candidate division TA06 bacterium]|nr:50S ribosomal protein L13 [candidate division TA06 bacterium]